MSVWLREVEVAKERVRHGRVVVLAGVYDEGLEARGTLLHGGDDRRHLHEVRPRTDDVNDFQHLLSFVLCSLCFVLRPSYKAPGTKYQLNYNRITRALASRRISPFSALRVSTTSETIEHTCL